MEIPVYLIATILFSYYLYIFTSNYLQYRTITYFASIRSYHELPQLERSLCYLGSASENQVREEKLLLNGKNVHIQADKFALSGTPCHILNVSENHRGMDDEIFEIEDPKVDVVYLIMRNLKREARYCEQNIYAPLLRNNNSYQFDLMVIELLPPPYDTECRNYNISARYHVKSCSEKHSQDVAKHTDCYRNVGEDCLKILYHFTLRRSPRPQSYVSVYGSNSQAIKADMSCSISLFIQQVIGLVTTFFEVCIMDLKMTLLTSIMTIFRYFRKMSESSMMNWIFRHATRSFRLVISKLILFFILIGFIFELYRTTNQYMKYLTDTETFVGGSSTQYIPTIGLCFAPDDISNITLDSSNKLFKVSFLHKLKIKNTFMNYVNGRKCFSIVPSATEVSDPSSRDIATISIFLNLGTDCYADFSTLYPGGKSFIHPPQAETMSLSTSVRQQKNLPAPFHTKCFSYKDYGLISRVGCYERCVLSRISNHSLFSLESYGMGANISTSNLTSEFCEQCDALDCIETWLFVHDVESIALSTHKIVKLSRQYQLISIKMIPKQLTSEFLTFTASLISLYLGISFVSLLQLFHRTFKKIESICNSPSLVIIQLLLMILLILHCQQLTANYFSYPTVSVVNYIGRPKTVLPSLSISFALNNRTANKESFDNETLENISPSQLDKYFKDNVDILKSIHLLKPSYSGYDVYDSPNLTSITSSYVYKDKKIITIDPGELQPGYYIYDWKIVQSRAKLMILDLDQTIGFSYERELNVSHTESSVHSVYLHRNRHEEAGTKSSSLPYKSRSLYYESSQTLLLKYPYESKCIDYTDPIHSNHSVFNCIIRDHFVKYGKIPTDMTVPITYTHQRMPGDRKIIDKCESMYGLRPYCDSTHYFMHVVFRRTTEYDGDLYFAPTTRQTYCEVIPKMSLLDLSLLMAESFDIWLGISLYLILRRVFQFSKFYA